MTRRPPPYRPLLAVGAMMAAIHLVGCAEATPAPTVTATPSAAPTPNPTVTMAPIANPEHETPRREPAPEPRQKAMEAPAGPKRETPAPAHAGAGPTQNLIRASSLRERGLEELNRGAVAHAVALLTEASRLAPGNALIRADLERAQRISRAVHAPH